MKYLVLILSVLLIAGSGLGYWYFRDSQSVISTLTENNAELELSVQLNEQTITNLEKDYDFAQQEVTRLNEENTAIQRRNNLLVERFANNDIGFLAENKPELIERLINRGTANAFRCMELLSGAELTEQERNADNDTTFNNECPWLFNTLVQP